MRRRRRQQDDGDAFGGRLGDQRVGLVGRQVGDHDALYAVGEAAMEEALRAVGEHVVDVDEQHERHVVAAVRLGEIEDVVGRDAGGERRVGRGLHDRSVGDRVGVGHAELDDVGAGAR